MIMNCYIPQCTVISKPDIRVVNDKTYCKLGILSGNSVGEISCSPDVYNGVNPGKIYDFTFCINTDYNNVFISLKNFHECK